MEDLLFLSPEIVLGVAAFVVLTLEISWNDEKRSGSVLPWVAFSGAIGALLATIYIWPLAGNGYVATDLANAVPMVAVDHMALFFKILAALTVALVGLSAVDYIRTRTPFRGEFYALTMLAGLSLMFLSSATNLVLIYISLEFLSITSYILTGYLRQDNRSTEAAVKYFIYGAVASGVMLYGFSLLYGATGTVDLVAMGGLLTQADVPGLLIVPAVLMILAGFGFKIALVPFHQWSPDAYEGAPTPITAFLSVGPKAAGLAVLIRLLVVALPAYAFNWTVILAVLSILTMSLGNLVALSQTNMKRMLAYSSIAQAGYMLIGLAAWSANPGSWGNVSGILLFLFAYLFTNLGVFAVAIILENRLGTANIQDYAGLIRRSPYLSIALLIFFLSLIGIPPTGGFMGKLFVFGAALDRGLYLLAAFGILNSVISVYYYFGVARLVFFGEAADESPIRPGLAMGGVVAVTLIMTLVIAIFGQPFIQLANDSAQILAAAF